jgi:hypothetical protein
MCRHSPGLTFEHILADDLVRLVMASDGIDEAELRLVLENARRAVNARDSEAGISERRRSVAAEPRGPAERARAEPAFSIC